MMPQVATDSYSVDKMKTDMDDDSEAGHGGKNKPTSLVARIRKALWGDLPREEYKKFALLSLTFLFIVGTYWLLRTQKDALFMKITGKLYIPYAKMGSFFVMVPLILGYCKLVDLVEKHVLFYVICGGYGCLFLCVSLALMIPGVGPDETIPASPTRILGWVIYLGIETFGSLTVPLFWSFVNSISDTKSAKAGFGLITWGAQFGSIAGPTLGKSAKKLGMAPLMLIGTFGIFMVPFMVKVFVTAYPSSKEGSIQKRDTGILEGIRLIFKHKYLVGVFGIATFYEVIGTVLDYQMKFQLDSEFSSAAEVAAFMGGFGQAANGLAFCFSLVGTGFFINNFGIVFCLVCFPVTVALVVVYVWFNPSVHVLFYAMVVIKGLSYALNNPCKEILYIPTTKDVKFKAKSWIDMFGGRAAKSVGSLINAQLKTMAALATYSGPINLTIIAVWVSVALYTGRTNQKMVKYEIVVGEEQKEEHKNLPPPDLSNPLV
uniref:ADP,ATP carrier protein n=1 Tax=Eutreptiella gymnastica TaxID=73025 RepID=A0A7S1N3C9_9EUGL|mmetsp:Transcript_11325/g.20396  ORF Transcript_11325/g.20396 Transcript_11325/m.20396 type:complete len:488 (+) Transcript_11325:42-1505(+)